MRRTTSSGFAALGRRDIRAHSRSSVTAYVVEVDRPGAANAIAPAPTDYQPSEAQIGYFLARFGQNTRALSVDPIVVRQAWLDAYDQITNHAKPVLDDYARQADLFGKVGHRAVTAEVTSVVRASDKSVRITWIEHAYEEGASLPPERWSAILTVIVQTPRTEERLRKNPLGIYIDAIARSRELGAVDEAHSATGHTGVAALGRVRPANNADQLRRSGGEPCGASEAYQHRAGARAITAARSAEAAAARRPIGGVPEPRDPARRVQLANAAASVKPTRAGYVNAIQVYPYSGGALYQLYVAPVHVTDIALEPGEELKAVAAGDMTQWKIGDTESGSGGSRHAHVLVKPVSADLPMNNILIATDRRTLFAAAELRQRHRSAAQGTAAGIADRGTPTSGDTAVAFHTGPCDSTRHRIAIRGALVRARYPAAPFRRAAWNSTIRMPDPPTHSAICGAITPISRVRKRCRNRFRSSGLHCPVISGDRCSSKAGYRLPLIRTRSAVAASESKRPPRSCSSPSRQNRRLRLDPPRIELEKMAQRGRCRTRRDGSHLPPTTGRSRMANRRSCPLLMHGLTRRSIRRSACSSPAVLTSSWRVP